MERRLNARKTHPTPAAILLVFVFVATAVSSGQTQTLVGDIGNRAVASSGLSKPALTNLSGPSTGQPPASGNIHSVGMVPGNMVPRAILPPQSPLIVIGFAGGFVRPTSIFHGDVGFAMRLRQKYGPAIHTEVFANHRGDDAHREILRLVRASSSTTPSNEKKAARIILYGHSWGASEAVAVARRLQNDGIPVWLIVQVDAVSKGGHDGIIPANVAQAINFYQSDGILHGHSRIRAANPAATKIIGNFHLTYKADRVPCPGYPWYDRVFTRPHIEIENDPRVWNQVEALIVSKNQ